MTVAGAGIGLFAVLWETALAQRIPPHLLSRVSAWDWMGSLALLPAGYLLSGWLSQMISAVHYCKSAARSGLSRCCSRCYRPRPATSPGYRTPASRCRTNRPRRRAHSPPDPDHSPDSARSCATGG
jgi:hypothetical protein